MESKILHYGIIGGFLGALSTGLFSPSFYTANEDRLSSDKRMAELRSDSEVKEYIKLQSVRDLDLEIFLYKFGALGLVAGGAAGAAYGLGKKNHPRNLLSPYACAACIGAAAFSSSIIFP